MKPFRGIETGKRYMRELGFGQPLVGLSGNGEKVMVSKQALNEHGDSAVFELHFDKQELCVAAEFYILKNGKFACEPIKYIIKGGEFINEGV